MVEYRSRMQEIVRRTNAINKFTRAGGKGLPWIIVIEVIHLQLRHILELIATALLVVNEDAMRKSGNQNIGLWHALDILNAIEAVNGDFYPKPSKPGEKDEEGVIPLKDVGGDVLTKEKFTTLYKRCGAILHTRNPFAKKAGVRLESKQDCEKLLVEANRWQSRIVRLLTHHQFKLKDDESLYIAHTVGTDHVFQVVEFVKLPPQ